VFAMTNSTAEMPPKPEVSPLERVQQLLESGKKRLDSWTFTFAMTNSTAEMPPKPEISALDRVQQLLESGKKRLDSWTFTFAMTNSSAEMPPKPEVPALDRVQQLLESGKKSLDSWTIITYGGLSDFQEALKIQQAEGMRKVQMAETHICIARAFHKVKWYGSSLKEFMRAVHIFERENGRYHLSTGEVYVSIANLLLDAGSPQKSLTAWYTAARIEHRLFGLTGPWKTSVHIHTILARERNHLPKEEIQGRMTLLHESIEHEIMGDLFVKQNKYASALSEYTEAAIIEEKFFGILGNPNLALVRRKIAELPTRPEVSSDAFKQVRNCPSPAMCDLIHSGDGFYFASEFQKATALYEKAGVMVDSSNDGCAAAGGLASFLLAFLVVAFLTKQMRGKLWGMLWAVMTTPLVLSLMEKLSQAEEAGGAKYHGERAIPQIRKACEKMPEAQEPELTEHQLEKVEQTIFTSTKPSVQVNERKEAVEPGQPEGDEISDLHPRQLNQSGPGENVAANVIGRVEEEKEKTAECVEVDMAASVERLGQALACALDDIKEGTSIESSSISLLEDTLHNLQHSEDGNIAARWTFQPNDSITFE
jgi:hypothetical protein